MTISTPEAPAPPLVPLVARLSPVSIGGMLLLAVLWGLSIPITKLGLDSTPPIAFTALRFSVAAPCLFLFALGRHRIRSEEHTSELPSLMRISYALFCLK